MKSWLTKVRAAYDRKLRQRLWEQTALRVSRAPIKSCYVCWNLTDAALALGVSDLMLAEEYAAFAARYQQPRPFHVIYWPKDAAGQAARIAACHAMAARVGVE